MYRKIFIIWLLLAIPAVASAGFSDVPYSHKYASEIGDLQSRGIIGGYPDGTYKPDAPVSRAEAMKIIVGAAGRQAPTNVNNKFPDVQDGQWYTEWVLNAKYNGIVQGYPDGSFGVSKNMNLAEAMKIILKAYQVETAASVSSNPYPDVQKDTWFAPFFAYAREKSLLDTDSKGNVSPNQTVSRGMLAQIMSRLLAQRDAFLPDISYGDPSKVLASKDGQNLTQAHMNLYYDLWSYVMNSPVMESDRKGLEAIIIKEFNENPVGILQGFSNMLLVLQEAAYAMSQGITDIHRAQLEANVRTSASTTGAEDDKYIAKVIDAYNKTLASENGMDFKYKDALAATEYLLFLQSLQTGQNLTPEEKDLPAYIGIMTEKFKSTDQSNQQAMITMTPLWANIRLVYAQSDEVTKKQIKDTLLGSAQQQTVAVAQPVVVTTPVDTYQDTANQMWNQYNLNNYTSPSYVQSTIPTYDPGYNYTSSGGEMSDSTYNTLRNALLESHATSMNILEGIDGSYDSYYSTTYDY